MKAQDVLKVEEADEIFSAKEDIEKVYKILY